MSGKSRWKASAAEIPKAYTNSIATPKTNIAASAASPKVCRP